MPMLLQSKHLHAQIDDVSGFQLNIWFKLYGLNLIGNQSKDTSFLAHTGIITSVWSVKSSQNWMNWSECDDNFGEHVCECVCVCVCVCRAFCIWYYLFLHPTMLTLSFAALGYFIFHCTNYSVQNRIDLFPHKAQAFMEETKEETTPCASTNHQLLFVTTALKYTFSMTNPCSLVLHAQQISIMLLPLVANKIMLLGWAL